ncbi:MAG: NIPSNAP family protein [Bryobacteraceae bacterium]|nr:NIPSNAP family protein [Bryobacteraceae bacterium]MCO5353096.1 NIPSNAP family protein [Bryobacteraceae bacterium]
MTRSSFLLSAAAAAALPGAAAAQSNRVFELRTYYTLPGRLPNLLARFRDHTVKLFEKHGMTNVGYWVPADAPGSENTLIYVLAHASRDAAKQSWDAFRTDPAWLKARAESEKDGKIVDKVEAVYLNPVDFSALR